MRAMAAPAKSAAPAVAAPAMRGRSRGKSQNAGERRDESKFAQHFFHSSIRTVGSLVRNRGKYARGAAETLCVAAHAGARQGKARSCMKGMKGIDAMAFSIGELVSAVFNGAPTPEAAEKYTGQLTALISLYICFVAIFVVGVYVRSAKKRRELQEERRLFKIWIAYSLIFSILAIAAYLLYFLISAS
jgi:hypothetical protein